MSIRLQWLPNASASALHAAECCYRYADRITDSDIIGTIGDFATRLGRWIEQLAGPGEVRFWNLLIGQASMIESNQELAEIVLRKAVGPAFNSSMQTQLAGFITDIEAAYKTAYPKFAEQANLRIRPLQEQWLGFGQGLMAHLGRLTDKSLLVSDCTVLVVQPVLGGAGTAHIEQNLARMEAVLTNPLSELPEVVRLAWLISQLQLDLPIHTELLGSAVVAQIGPLAMLPPILASAEVLELSRCDEATAQLAIEQWPIPVPEDMDLSTEIIPQLMDWWETYLQTRPNWHTAMRALAKMMGVQ